MTLFYDPQKRQPKIWAIIAFIIIPLIVAMAAVTIGKQRAGEKKATQEAEVDIFEKF